jgi:hypothetical protein
VEVEQQGQQEREALDKLAQAPLEAQEDKVTTGQAAQEAQETTLPIQP